MKSFKKKEWIMPNKMKFESGFKKFDKQVDYISTGNVISAVQYSSIIRPYSETNGGICEPGKCRQFDINNFRRAIPCSMRDWLAEHPEEKVWLYNFHFKNTNANTGASVGWVLTDYAHKKVILSTHCSNWGDSYLKRRAVIDEAIKYVVKGNWK